MARRRIIRRVAAPLAAGGIIVLCVTQVSAAPAGAPTAETGAATDVTLHTAMLHGVVNPNGSETTYYFRYGRTPPLTRTTPVQNAGDGTADVAVEAAVGDLFWGREYQYRLVAENPEGVATGDTRQFRTHEPRLGGPYVARLRVTSGGASFGQHRGTRVSRAYRLKPRKCATGICEAVRLNREGKRGHFRTLLKHRARGVYIGSDPFRGRCDNGLRYRSRTKTRLEVRRVTGDRATALSGSLRLKANGCIHGGERAKLKASAG